MSVASAQLSRVPRARRPAAADAADAADAVPELVLPAFDLRALVRRAAVPALLLAAAVAAVAMSRGPLEAFAGALGRALGADPRWVLAAAVCEALSFAGYASLLWLVGSGATSRLDAGASAQVTLGGAAATRLLPTGGVGGAVLTVWAFRRAGLSPREATRTLLVFLAVLYAVFLAAIVVAGGLLALGLVAGDGPLALSAVPAAAAGLAIGLGILLAGRRPNAMPEPPAAPASTRLELARAGVRSAPGALGPAIRDALAIVRRGDVRLLGALAWWGFDAAVLWAMLNALGTPPAITVVVLGYFVGQLANTLPIPGAVSGGMVGVLLAFGVQADLALASVFAYRAVSAWLPAPVGLAALSGLRQTTARWNLAAAPA